MSGLEFRASEQQILSTPAAASVELRAKGPHQPRPKEDGRVKGLGFRV